MAGQDGLKLRSEDPLYLELVDRWWSVLLPKIGRFLVERGGNILMVQVNLFAESQDDMRRHLEQACAFIMRELIDSRMRTSFHSDLHQPCSLMATCSLFWLRAEVHFTPVTLSSERRTHPSRQMPSCGQCAQIVSATSKAIKMTGLLLAGAYEKCIKHLVRIARFKLGNDASVLLV